MVHALDEIKRTLIPGGLLIDLRPVLGSWPVEVSWRNGYRETGRLKDLPEGLADDKAANHAMDEAARMNWFVHERGEGFPLFYAWDSPNEMEEFVREEWDQFIKLDEDIIQTTKSTWAVADAEAQVRVRASMMVNLWRRPKRVAK